jgi:phosphoserine phosphatase
MVKLAVFDMDGVLVEPRSSWRIVHRQLGTENEEAYRLYMEGRIDDPEFMRRDIAVWKERMPTIDIRFIEGLFKDLPLMKGCREALSDLRMEGFDLIVISGGLDSLSERIGREIPFSALYCNGLEHDRSGRLTGEGILRVPLRDKGGVLRGHLDGGDYDWVACVGDSIVDVTMFAQSDLSIAFRPMDDHAVRGADMVIDSMDLRAASDAIIQSSHRLS